ncbi:ABC transporter permease [Halegenticoccus soli]|uniref:ABC transporter permease n=1 Tax=Halegenticoccus soli TaxID=1985678 RepID=UPI000C6DDCF7|nr:ABC transporter permease subunit [Halegenticoccus soli]
MSVDTGGRLRGVDAVTAGRLLVPVALVLLWQALATVAGEFALATPAATVGELLGGFADGWLLADLRITLFTLAVAYALAVLVGVWVGVALGLSDFWREVFEPLILGVYSVPKVTLYPVFLFVFALGVESKIAFGWFHGVFPVAILTMAAMETVEDDHLKIGRSLLLSRWQTFREIIVPSILPGLVIGLRLGFNLTFLGVVLGEMFASRAGLGYTLVEYIVGAQIARMLAIIVVLVAVAAAVNVAFFAAEKRLGARGGETADVRM